MSDREVMQQAFDLWYSTVGKHYNADIHEIKECFFDAWTGRKDEIESLRQQVDLWKSSYLEQVELHNKTLDEVARTEQRVKELEDHLITMLGTTNDLNKCRQRVNELKGNIQDMKDEWFKSDQHKESYVEKLESELAALKAGQEE